jgi:hypothetical protein
VDVRIITQDLWLSRAQIIAVTTNNIVGRHGLVMGAGSALQAKNQYPWLPKAAAQVIGKGDYGFVVANGIGLFQTKRDWRDPSCIKLIQFSCEKLNE